MRLTIDIPNEIHARLKALARAEKTTMRAIVLKAVEAELRGPRSPAHDEQLSQA